MTLSPKHEQVMLFIQRHFALSGRAPTLEDICAACDLSARSRAHAAVSALIAQGYLARDGQKARGLILLKTIPDDRLEEAAKHVCRALGLVTPDNIKTARDALAQALMTEAA